MSAAATVQSDDSVRGKFTLLARDIKISHTVFALPWALLAAFLAAGGSPGFKVLLLILACMFTARTVALAANRLLDAPLDALNPRTASRALPSGRLSRRFYGGVVSAAALLFVISTWLFWILLRNPWPLALSLPVLGFLSFYPLLKRFTRWCHYYLGAALALAPVCAWIAVAGRPGLVVFCIAVAVLFWTAGFDIIYACQDYQSDLQTGVNSVPAKFGIDRALWLARASHILSFLAMFAVGVFALQLSAFYFAGVACAGLLLCVEHALVSADDLSKVNLAFFTVNGSISLLVGALGIVDVLRH